MLDIFATAERLRRMPRPQRIETLRQMIKAEPLRSLARLQLEQALSGQMLRQLNHEARIERKAS